MRASRSGLDLRRHDGRAQTADLDTDSEVDVQGGIRLGARAGQAILGWPDTGKAVTPGWLAVAATGLNQDLRWADVTCPTSSVLPGAQPLVDRVPPRGSRGGLLHRWP
jgi:hypothetical protein